MINGSIAIELLGGQNYSFSRADTIISIGNILGNFVEIDNYMIKVKENPFYEKNKNEIEDKIKWLHHNLC